MLSLTLKSVVSAPSEPYGVFSMFLKSEPDHKESDTKKININTLKFLGILLVGTFLIATIFSDIGFGAGNNPAISNNAITNANANQIKDPNAAKYPNKVIQKMDLNKQRKAAEGRYKAALKKLKIKNAPRPKVAILNDALVSAAALPTGMDPGGLPHYYGPYPNYANSPIPTLTTSLDPTTVGNALNDRTFASDYPVAIGQLAPVLVIIPSAVLPEGTLVNFQTWNQVTNGSSPFPSAGNIFYAYVLRPIGLNQYQIVFNSSELTVPDPSTPGTSEIATFPIGPFTVLAGDVIGFYGQGIPLSDTGGNDILSYPAPAPPADGSTITLGVDPGFPIYSQDRNYAISATVEVSASALTGGIRKFVDSLPGLDPAGANNLGKYIPIAVPDSCTYSGQLADCYEIELREYTEKMHSDLPPTKLRGYVQVKNGADVAPIHYLGPLIVAKRDTPVRIKFTNKLPTGARGDLFLPVDTTVMGAGPFMIDDPANPGNTISGDFAQNRATIHLHGGFVPWISDGTPHQWITPAGETTAYPKGVSVYNVPDMPDPGDGSQTFYYNNNQSARLQFYHDHSFGITRLNVYAGEAAGYLVTDQVEQDMIKGTNDSGVNPGGLQVLPGVGIPLIIQDKTFVDENTIAEQDPTWNWGTGTRDANGKITGANTGDLWLPHVFMPNQNPSDESGTNAFGRWFYAPWFYPAPTDIIHGPIPNPYCLPTPGVDCSASVWPFEHTLIPDVPNPSIAAEAFMDTPIVNGAAYPYLEVDPKAYRFRILNAANDRFLNLQMYVATTQDGRTLTEVKMVPAVLAPGYPAGWPTDGREGGVPDPATAGPSFIQIGTEGGFLPAPVVLPNKPVTWNLNPTTFDVGNVNGGTLILGTAERADVIVDFSAFAGQTLILYNDAPAAFPAIDTRYDYYTGDPDQTGTGGAPSTLAGYGPNTRTIMQIRVKANPVATTYPLATLQAVFAKTPGKRGVFESSQDEIIVAQKAYETAYDTIYPADKFVGINDKNKSFKTALGTPMNILFNLPGLHDEQSGVYSVEDGRMSAMLGSTIPGIPGFVPIPYIAPPVEIVKDSVYGTALGSLGDGTQIWKLNHNGVDTHTIHFHLFNVQLINRVAWDNIIRKPDSNEVGWKETLRVNPLQDTIVALRPVAPTTPFKVPNSIRLLDPTMPDGFPLKPPPFGWANPNGNPVTVLNHEVNLGWEYVYHCHLLGHEEMDMMHEVSLTVAPDAPIIQSATLNVNQVTVNWTDNSISETGFIVQRNTSAGAWITLATVPSTTGPGTGALNTYVDTTVVSNTTYNYRVLATNVVGDTQTPGFPTMSADSLPSGIVTVTTPLVAVVAPTNLGTTINGGPLRIVLTWTDRSNNENRFAVWRSVNGGAFTQIGIVSRTNAQRIATGGTVTFSNTNAVAALVAGNTYNYYVTAISNTLGSSLPSNTATVLFAAPAAPSGLTGIAVRIPANNAQDSITLTWTDNANNENDFQIQRAATPAFNNPASFTVGANIVPAPSTVTFSQNANRPRTYYYQVRARNIVGNSAWTVFGPLNAP